MSKKARWIIVLLVTLTLLAAVVGLYRSITSFNRSLIRFAELCDGKQSQWSAVVDEVAPDTLKKSAYEANYWKSSRIPAVAGNDWVYNSSDGASVPAFRCNGMLYIVVHKWKNFAAGVCVPIENSARSLNESGFDYFPIAHSQWQYWKADMER